MTTPQPSSPGAMNWFILICLGLIWGASFMGVKQALTGFGPLTVAALRITLAAILLVAVAEFFGDGLPDRKSPTGRRIWLHCLGMAIFTNVLPFSLLSWGQQFVTSGFAGITMAVVPLLVLPLAHFLVPGDQMSLRKTIGFLIGFTGIFVLIGADAIFAKDGNGLFLAQLACVAASLGYATGSIITRLTPKVSRLSFSAAGLLIASIMILPVALAFEGLPEFGNSTANLAILYLGIMPTAIATLLLVQVVSTAGPSFLSLVNYQVPVWAVVIGSIIYTEPLPGQFAWALGLILAGLLVSQARFFKSQKRTGDG